MKIKIKKFNLTISMTTIAWFFLIIWNFEPQYFREGYLPLLHTIFVWGRLAASFIIIFNTILHFAIKKDYIPSHFILYISIGEFILLLASVINPDASKIVRVLLDNVLLTLCFSMALDYMLYKNARKAIKVLVFISELLIYGNFVTMLMFPDGLYNVVIGNTRKYWFLGQQNQVILYVLIGMVATLIHSYYVQDKKILSFRSLLYIGVCVYMELAFKSANGLVGLAVFGLIFFLTEFRHINIDLRWGLLLSTLIFAVFIVFQTQELFSNLIVNVLHRDLTASTRTIVWDRALFYINQNPILGYGVEASELAINKFGYITPHNRCLYLMYRGGIVLLVAFLIMIIGASRHLSKVKGERISVYMIAGAFALLLQMQFESYDTMIFYVIFIMAYHVRDLIVADGR
jgi:O-antigen ligase